MIRIKSDCKSRIVPFFNNNTRIFIFIFDAYYFRRKVNIFSEIKLLQGLHLCLCKLSGDSRTLLEVPQNAWQAPEDVALGNKASSSFSLTRKNKIAAEDCL